MEDLQAPECNRQREGSLLESGEKLSLTPTRGIDKEIDKQPTYQCMVVVECIMFLSSRHRKPRVLFLLATIDHGLSPCVFLVIPFCFFFCDCVVTPLRRKPISSIVQIALSF